MVHNLRESILKWLSKSDNQEEADTYFILGQMYSIGMGGLPQDDARAAQLTRKGAEQGHAWAQQSLASRYAKGRGVPQDDREAVKWFRKAADQGVAEAQYGLGYMYRTGRGVQQDDTQAAIWLRKSADQGEAPAQYQLGLMYSEGQGVPQDLVSAYMWFDLVAANLEGEQRGEVESKRDAVAKDMTPEQIDTAKKMARNWRPKGRD